MDLATALATLPVESPLRDIVRDLANNDLAVRNRARELLRRSGFARPMGATAPAMDEPVALAILRASLEVPFPPPANEWERIEESLLFVLFGSVYPSVVTSIQNRFGACKPRLRATLLALIASADGPEAVLAIRKIIARHGWPSNLPPRFWHELNQHVEHLDHLFPEILEARDAPVAALLNLALQGLHSGSLNGSNLERSAPLRRLPALLRDERDEPIRALYLAIAGFVGSEAVIDPLRAAADGASPYPASFAIASLLRRGHEVPDQAIERVAADLRERATIYRLLSELNATDRIPSSYRTRDAFAETDMVGWLSHPGELGEPPEALERMGVLDTTKNREPLVLYLWRFKTKTSEWMAAVSGPYPACPPKGPLHGASTFSRFEVWDSKTPQEHVTEILGNLAEWEQSFQRQQGLALGSDGARARRLRLHFDPRAHSATVRTTAALQLASAAPQPAPLEVGDVLAFESHTAVVGCITDQASADIVWPTEGNDDVYFVRKVERAVEQLFARSIGAYSALTQQPTDQNDRPGQFLSVAHRQSLEAAGAWHLVRELLTIKSNDVRGRMRTYENVVSQQEAPEPGWAEHLVVALKHLEALGFAVETSIQRSELNEDELLQDIFSFFEKPEPVPTRLGIGLMSSDEVRQRSHGVVEHSGTLDTKSAEAEMGGLFCPRVFGPTRDYECACGKCNAAAHRGVVCDECGVEVVASKVRRTRIGHLELPAPLLHPWAMDIAAELLRVPSDRIRKVLFHGRTLAGEAATTWKETGAWCLQEALREVDLNALCHERGDAAPIATLMRDSRTLPESLIFNAWPVLPPDLRPVIRLAEGRWACSDLNAFYGHLIEVGGQLGRAAGDPGTQESTLIEKHRQMQYALQALVQNGLDDHWVQSEADDRLVSLDALLSKLLRTNLVAKRMDYTGAATAVLVDGPRRQLALPREMARELFKPWVYGLLIQRGVARDVREARALLAQNAPAAGDALAKVASNAWVLACVDDSRVDESRGVGGYSVRLWDAAAVGMTPADADKIGLRGDGGRVIVHVPIGAKALEETKGLEPSAGRQPLPAVEPTGWLGKAATTDQLGTALMIAAIGREADSLEDRTTRTITGRLDK